MESWKWVINQSVKFVTPGRITPERDFIVKYVWFKEINWYYQYQQDAYIFR